MTDTLGAFNWICDDSNMATTGKILFYSKSLKSGKGLRNLIQAAGGSGSWISNSVQVEVTSGAQVGTIYASSSPAVWWDNPVQQLPVNTGSTASTLLSDTTHPVYVVGAGQNTEGGYQIGADGISIVTLGSAILNQTGSTFAFNCKTDGGSSAVGLDVRGIFCGYQKKYLWFEVHLDGGSVSSTNYAGAGIILNGAKLTRIQDSTLNNFNGTTVNSAISLISSSKNILINTDVYNANSALSLNSSSFNLIRNLQAARIQFTGTAKVVSLNASDSNKLTDIQISGVSTTDVAVGIYSNFSNFNIFQRVFISNIDAKLSEGKGYGILLTDAMDHILSQITIAGVEGAGIQLNGSFDNSANYLSHINFVNNTVSGLDLRGGLVSDNIYNSLVLTNNKANIWIRGDVLYPSIDNNFYNIVSTSSTDSDGSVNIDVNYQSTFIGYLISNFGGVNTCIKGTTSVVSNLTSSCLGTPESTLNSAINSFVGKITVDDVISTIDTLGQSAFSLLTTLTRWSEFAFGFRGWGNDGSVFPNSNNQGPCDGSSDCRIWDFRLKSGSALENRSFNYTSTNAAINFVGGSCTSFLDGNATFTLESRVFMKFAIELDNDNVGNDNGLCEDNEHCIYTPNIGAYQGEGMISSSNYCVTGTSTNVKNAKIFKYPTTSVP